VLRSLFSGITGLRQHQTMMDVVGNNIANVNTTGYKSSSVVFEDTLSQMMKSPGAPGESSGGMNPSQVGLGVQLGGIGTNFTQGSAQNTGRSTDMMIQGDGFFVLNNGDETVYSRNGAFSFDAGGSLVNNEGMHVQGWSEVGGVINADGPTADVQLPTGTVLPPVASSQITLGGNIQSSMAIGGTLTLSSIAYDLAGNDHPVTVLLTKTGDTTFSADVSDATVGSTPTPGAISFDPTGIATVDAEPNIVLADGTTVTIDLATLTQFGGPKTIAVTDKDGSAAGTLQQFQISTDGTVVGMFTNGVKRQMAQIALANFNNPQGLEKGGNSVYRTTVNSGLAQVGTAGGGQRGALIGGALEMSNVDLGQEFTNLIVAQRGFQANSKVITSSDEMLQDLVNLKR
jgi:flagellar hook protein FlgE